MLQKWKNIGFKIAIKHDTVFFSIVLLTIDPKLFYKP